MNLLDGLKAASSAANDPNAPEGGAVNAFAPAWRWEDVGDGVEGVVVAVDMRVHDNHPEGYPIVTVRQEDGTPIAIHGMMTVLKNEINKLDPKPGDTFAAIYDGKKVSGGGRQFHAFRVAHVRGTGSVPTVPVPAAVVNSPWAPVSNNHAEIPPF